VTRPLFVEVFADIACPFTHVGLRRLVGLRSRFGRSDVVLRARAWPLELVNGEPLAVGATSEKVARLRETVAPDLFVGFDPRRFPSTSMPALALAAAAYAQDDRTGEQVSLALRNTLFEDGLDVADPAVLASIAQRFALPPQPESDRSHESVRADWREGIARGVLGSPHFFVGGRGFFCPSLDIHERDGTLDLAVDTAAFTEFVAAVFGERVSSSD
jgi:predicted DsbA family dithiol-disulfide isomerase